MRDLYEISTTLDDVANSLTRVLSTLIWGLKDFTTIRKHFLPPSKSVLKITTMFSRSAPRNCTMSRRPLMSYQKRRLPCSSRQRRVMLMNEIININYENADRPTVSGRELHAALGIETPYRIWLPRMCEYGFVEGEDYTPYIFVHPQNKQETTDHQITINMAKEICMIQRTDKGKQCRQYFLKIEEAWNSPEMIMKRALDIANSRVKALQLTVSTLTVENETMRPKADYFDDLVGRHLLTNIRDTAKELKVKQNVFVKFLLDKKYMYRDKKGKLQPYSSALENDLFEVKEFVNDKTGFTSTQTLVTPKGKETFRLLMIA